jgi:hypothetical protein
MGDHPGALVGCIAILNNGMEWLKHPGLNYNVEKVPMHTPEGNVVTDKYLLRREDNKFI